MDDAEISVTITPPRFGRPVTRNVRLGIHQARALLQPIDFPSADAGLAAMFCTPEADKKLLARHELAKHIAEVLGRALADALSDADTEMGYPKERSR